MKKALQATKQTFKSFCQKTPEYLAWHKLFKKEFTKFCKNQQISEIQFSKPNHFDLSGFFRTQNGQAWYFRIEDVRWSKESMLLRKAKDFHDFIGGINCFVFLNNAQTFECGFQRLIA